MAHFALGRKADSNAALGRMIKSETPRPFFVASVYAFRGESDEALKWLDTVYALRETALPLLKSQSMFGELEGDPRYKALLKKMKLPEWRRKREVMFRRPGQLRQAKEGSGKGVAGITPFKPIATWK
jgi:hypothetical protein